MTRYRIEFAETGELAAYARSTAEAARQLAIGERSLRESLDACGVAEIDGFMIVPCPARVTERKSRARH